MSNCALTELEKIMLFVISFFKLNISKESLVKKKESLIRTIQLNLFKHLHPILCLHVLQGSQMKMSQK